ncbi:FxSxx-COOH cyclophane-containing RiPP peptide [Microbispora sp. NPDC049125]|uniref:FxSxx-COOH cyclophane-containing RiPP peptide n=1 Tax=Microbispora sp. NPDC049125 TaxID=3154929 RepID=UPI00346527B6
MNIADGVSAEVASEISDLHDVRLTQIETLRGGELDATLRRVLPFSAQGVRVPVALFNSSI